MAQQLKPCPFCGKIPNEHRISIPFDVMHNTSKIARCQCGAFMNISRWNARPIEDQLNARIAKLEYDLADVKAKRDTLMGCFFEYETVVPNGDLMASVLDMNKRILELGAENKALKDKMRRIPVSEKLPENNDYVLFWEDDDDIFLGNYDVNDQEWESVEGYFWSGNQFKHITHWMYVPELPES